MTKTAESEKERLHAHYEANAQAIRARSSAYYADHREERRVSDARRYERTRDVRLAQMRERHERVGRDAYLRKTYGISLDGYNALLESQGGGCAICATPPEDSPLHVDHDHETGEVRGLLCFSCNIVLGHLGDDVDRVMSVAAYLMQATNLLKNGQM